jgi:hypothetical protein
VLDEAGREEGKEEANGPALPRCKSNRESEKEGAAEKCVGEAEELFGELVGLGSYLLIGFWWFKPALSDDPGYQRMKGGDASRSTSAVTTSPAL